MDDIQTLFNQLKDPDDSIRSRSINKLRKMGDKKAVKPILEMLSDKDWGVRADAIEALGELGDNSIEEILIKYLDDENLIVKRETIYALGKIGSSKSIEKIEQIAHSSYGELKTAAIKTLEKMGHKPEDTSENSELLINVLKDINSSIFDKRYAAEILGKRGDLKAIGPLLAIVYSGNEAQDKAKWALLQMNNGVGETILELLENEYRLKNQSEKYRKIDRLLEFLLSIIGANKFKKKEAINQLLIIHDFLKNKDDTPPFYDPFKQEILELINKNIELLGGPPSLKKKINNQDIIGLFNLYQKHKGSEHEEEIKNAFVAVIDVAFRSALYSPDDSNECAREIFNIAIKELDNVKKEKPSEIKEVLSGFLLSESQPQYLERITKSFQILSWSEPNLIQPIIPLLINHLQYRGWESLRRISITIALISKISPELVTPHLSLLIERFNWRLDGGLTSSGCSLVIADIAEINPKILIPVSENLIKYLYNLETGSWCEIRSKRSAIFALGQIGTIKPELVLPILEKYLHDKDDLSRHHAEKFYTQITGKKI